MLFSSKDGPVHGEVGEKKTRKSEIIVLHAVCTGDSALSATVFVLFLENMLCDCALFSTGGSGGSSCCTQLLPRSYFICAVASRGGGLGQELN